jgi:soluble cytochrome b562
VKAWGSIASAPRGKLGKRHPIYHCSRGHKYWGLNKKDFESTVTDYLEGLEIEKDSIGYIQEAIGDVWEKRKKEVLGSYELVQRNVKELENKKETYIESFAASDSKVIKRSLEEKIEVIEKEIQQAEQETKKLDISEQEFKSFQHSVKYFVEHFEELLYKSKDPRKNEAMFELLFQEMPSYQEINSGTPHLSPIFSFSENFAKSSEKAEIPIVGREGNLTSLTTS